MLQSHNGLCSKIKKYAVSLAWAPLLMVGSAWASQPAPALRMINSLAIPVSALNTGTGTLPRSFRLAATLRSPGLRPVRYNPPVRMTAPALMAS